MVIRFSGKVTFPDNGKITLDPNRRIELINSTQNIQTTKSTSHSGDTPSDIQESDVLIAALSFSNNTNAGPISIASSNGFTLVEQAGVGNGATNRMTQSVWYKVATDSEPESYSWNWTTAQWPSFCILAFRNVNIENPIGESSSFVDDEVSPIVLPSITTTKKREALVMSFVIKAFDSGSNTINATPSGFTLAETGRNVPSVGGDNARHRFGNGFALAGDAGATGTQTFTFSSNDPNTNAPVGVMIALKPATLIY